MISLQALSKDEGQVIGCSLSWTWPPWWPLGQDRTWERLQIAHMVSPCVFQEGKFQPSLVQWDLSQIHPLTGALSQFITCTLIIALLRGQGKPALTLPKVFVNSWSCEFQLQLHAVGAPHESGERELQLHDHWSYLGRGTWRQGMRVFLKDTLNSREKSSGA